MNAHDRQVFNGSPESLQTRPCKARQSALRHLAGRIDRSLGYTIAGLILVIWVTIAPGTAALAAGRVALLLGAETYQNFSSSRITVAQTNALGAVLRKQGFDVMVVGNPGNAAARAALTEFSRKAQSADFALIVAAGHFATFRSQSFFLPINVRVRRATDLLSRGISAVSLANLAGRAKSGAVAMLTTVPDIPSTVAGIGARPALAGSLPGNVIAVFSSSSKVPVSGVDSVSKQAMNELINAAKETPMMLAALVEAASAGGTGRVIGTVHETNLSQNALPPSKPVDAAAAAAARAKEMAAKEAAQRAQDLATAKRQAEARAGEAERRAKLAEIRAREAEARAKRELATAQAQQAAAAAARAKEEAARKAAATKAEPRQTDTSNIQALQVVEALLGRVQRRTIQRILKTKGLYDGPIDAFFGEKTRAAIKAFQKQENAAETGYLTPDQFQKLIAVK
jgi:Putative peptidoglycan binding domain/Caspase domain